ncbi:MAG: hypothetical protein ACI82A_001297 [Candidatus Azotimanducaceae bacterium]|jgi:hypothetical protein
MVLWLAGPFVSIVKVSEVMSTNVLHAQRTGIVLGRRKETAKLAIKRGEKNQAEEI